MIANRLIEPLSEWALINWSQRTALPEILNVHVAKTSHDRLYRASDHLLTHRKDVEKGQLKNHSVIKRKIGSLKQKSPSVHRFYDFKHENKGGSSAESVGQDVLLCP